MPDSDDDIQFQAFDSYFSGLPSATIPLAGTEPMIVFQGNTTKQVEVMNVVRNVLLSSGSFFISATGSDSNDGLSLATAWHSTQHAMNALATRYDFAGQNVTVNIGAGSFPGFGVMSTVGGGNLLWKGAGSASTTITAGPNDGVFNFGENVTFNAVPSGTTHFFSGLKFANPSAFAHFAVYVPYPAIQLANFDGSAVDIAFLGGNGMPIFFFNSPCDVVLNATSPMTIDRTGSPSLVGEIAVTGSATLIIGTSDFNLIGSPTYTTGLIAIADGTSVEWQGFATSGSFTGNAANVTASVLNTAGRILSRSIVVKQGGVIY